jgi:Transposase DDE domain
LTMNLSEKDHLYLFAKVLREYMTPSALEKLARETKFIQRASKYGVQELVALCVWLSQNVASTSLVKLCSYLEAHTGVSISPEGLNQRFNEKAVDFLRNLFLNLMKMEVSQSNTIPSEYLNYFQRIRLTDSTSFQVPDSLAHHYPGAGGSGSEAGVKIQLEYELHSGQFLNVHLGAGRESDQTSGHRFLESVREGDCCIRDLGYFSLDDLYEMDQRGAFYVSRLKRNSRIYTKNPEPEFHADGRVKKSSEYLPLDVEKIMVQVKPGDTLEIPDTYIGKEQKLPSRVILYRLTEPQVKKRQKREAYKERTKGKAGSPQGEHLIEVNMYTANIPPDFVPMEKMHDLYSLRWQIEIVFKIWKSIFQIDHCKEIKLERLQCHFYGQLISILLCSSTMFRMRELLLSKKTGIK